ncbi:MAG: phage scaffolding protein [Ruminococcus sp.]|nr:phage scaffolding protein [Ruminococcus sp.]
MLEWLKTILADAYSDDIDTKVSAEIGKNFVAKADFNATNEAKKKLEATIGERDKQLEDLKKSSGDNADLKKQIEDLQKQNANQKKTHDAEINQLKLDNAVELALSGVKAKNSKAVKAMLNMENVKFDESGKLTGLDKQLEELKKSDSYMFDTAPPTQQQFKGFQPGASMTVSETEAAGYETRLADARKNNNQLEVIKIKQEAAEKGVILM